MFDYNKKTRWEVNELASKQVSKRAVFQVNKLTSYSQTELGLESHSCIVSKQKSPFPLRKGLLMPCYARLAFI